MQGRIVIIRHAETQWSINGRHTGSTDLPLTAVGRIKGELIGSALSEFRFGSVWTSPLRRAADTCRRAGLEHVARARSDLAEWDYGDYEGITTAEIIETRAGWDLWLHGAPGGESPDDVARVFLQIVGDDTEEIPIPGRPFGFSLLKQAQAAGDLATLRAHGLRAGRVTLADLVEEAQR